RARDGKLRKPRWRGRVPQALADLADADGILTQERVAAYYQTQHPYVSLESRQMLLEPAVADAAQRAATKTGLRAAPTLVYLANTIADAHGGSIPYSVVAALDASQAAPLGPFLPPGPSQLGD